MHTLIDQFNNCLIPYFKSNDVFLFFQGSLLHDDLCTETIEFDAYSNRKPIRDFLIDLFKQIGFDLVSHNFKFSGETYILPTTFKFAITKDEMYELIALLKLKGY